MATFTNAGRALMASRIQQQPLMLGWGRGTGDKQKESVEATTLGDLIGLRTLDTVAFCVPDSDGEWKTPQGNFAISQKATPALYLSCRFDFADAADETIQELGIFANTKTKSGLPTGQRYFTAEEITVCGILLWQEIIPPLTRSAVTREAFSFVIGF
nr:hypothetical protein 11 [Coxiellaceae bacterium]